LKFGARLERRDLSGLRVHHCSPLEIEELRIRRGRNFETAEWKSHDDIRISPVCA
jgi:hypothetical protein